MSEKQDIPRTPERSENQPFGDEDDDMGSPLNPDAKEFVPVSPQRSSAHSPFGNGGFNNIHRDLLMEDDIMAQSPRKGAAPTMDNNIDLPSENDFSEISKRPAEINENGNGAISPNGLASPIGDDERPDSPDSQYSYQEMNSKEAMHGDEKQEYAEDTSEGVNSEPLSEPQVDFHISGAISEIDPMNMSYYNDGTGVDPFSVPIADVDMNRVQQLPDDSNDENEQIAFDGNHKPDVSLLLDNDFMGDNKKEEGIRENGGAQFVIEDTEFGMEQQSEDALKPEADHHANEISVANHHFDENTEANHHVNEIAETNNHHDDDIITEAEFHADKIADDFHGLQIQNDRPESEHVEPASITDVVHELATHVTSVLKEFSDEDNVTSLVPSANENEFEIPHVEPTAPSAPSPLPELTPEPVINQEFVIKNEQEKLFDDVEIEEPVAVAQHTHVTSSAVESAPQSDFVLHQEIVDPVIENVPTPEPIVPQEILHQQIEPAVESEPQPDSNVEIVAAASVAAVTAVAAAAATVAAKTAAAPKAKPEAKARTSAPALGAKKTTAAAPLKSTRPISITKTATSPTKAAPPRAGVPAARTARAAPLTKAPIEKKAPLSSTAAKKPLTNGTATTLKKTTTTTSRPLGTTTKTTTSRLGLGTAATKTSTASTLSSRTSTTTTKTSATGTKTSTLSARPTSSTLTKAAPTTR